MEISSEHHNSQTVRARDLKFWHHVHLPLSVMCHMSCVTRDMSRVTCHMSHVTSRCHMWSLSVEGLLSTGPTSSSFYCPPLPFAYHCKASIYITRELSYSWLTFTYCVPSSYTGWSGEHGGSWSEFLAWIFVLFFVCFYHLLPQVIFLDDLHTQLHHPFYMWPDCGYLKFNQRSFKFQNFRGCKVGYKFL